jgi:hypothetical protein
MLLDWTICSYLYNNTRTLDANGNSCNPAKISDKVYNCDLRSEGELGCKKNRRERERVGPGEIERLTTQFKRKCSPLHEASRPTPWKSFIKFQFISKVPIIGICCKSAGGT